MAVLEVHLVVSDVQEGGVSKMSRYGAHNSVTIVARPCAKGLLQHPVAVIAFGTIFKGRGPLTGLCL